MSTSPTVAPGADTLVVRTRSVEDPGALLDLLPPTDASAWVRRGQGLVGWGTAARLDVDGPDRFEAAHQWWSALASRAVVRNDLAVPGTGLVAFGSFGFAPGSASQLVVPAVVVGHRVVDARPRWWVTTATPGSLSGIPELAPNSPPPAPVQLRFADGAVSGAEWGRRVSLAVQRIAQSPLEKVVLARDLIATAAEDIDVRWPLRRLAADYASCWTFAVDGLLGVEVLTRSLDADYELSLTRR